jgi:hypothetical protein
MDRRHTTELKAAVHFVWGSIELWINPTREVRAIIWKTESESVF